MRNNCHSFLFVPATEKLLKKIPTCTADAVIIDLEDSIPALEKDNALEKTVEFLKSYSYEREIYIRLNDSRLKQEISALDEFNISGYMLPKCENIEAINHVSELTKKEIIALIETAAGLINIDKISAHSRVSMLAFGAEDYTSECGIENEDKYLIYPKSRVVLYAKANKKYVIDTMSLNIRDRDAYKILAEDTKKYGFDAKLAIHPMQVDVINEVFNENIDYYEQIINQYEKKGLAVLEIDGRIYEKPHIDAMKKRLDKE